MCKYIGKPNDRLLKSLNTRSADLEHITDSFANLLEGRDFEICSFREQRDTYGIMIVDEFSSVIGTGRERKGLIDANHVDMVKYSGMEDQGYQRVLTVLKLWMKGLASLGDEEVERCLASLNIEFVKHRYEQIETPYDGTFDWIFSDKVRFTEWLSDATQSIFWIQGKPGSGKSTAMKFAMTDARTQEALSKAYPGTWLTHGFFFHDRGSHILQKSSSGLLCEILWGILQQDRRLARHVLPVYRTKVSNAGIRMQREWSHDGQHELQWNVHSLREAFIALCTQSDTKANILLFVDALDEHSEQDQNVSATHNMLLDVLKAAVLLTSNNDAVQLKLCLASRAQPEFVDGLREYWNFCIHEHTCDDIKLYVGTRLDPHLLGRPQTRTVTTMKGILSARAKGVLIWIRLAVDEMIQALQHGGGDEELEAIVNDLPGDLAGLYRRALNRAVTSRGTASAMRQQRHSVEIHIVLAVTLAYSHFRPFLGHLRELVSHIAAFLLEPKHEDWNDEEVDARYLQIGEYHSPGMTSEVGWGSTRVELPEYIKEVAIQRGLITPPELSEEFLIQTAFNASRSGGLIEVDKLHNHHLRFIHQTAKTYASSVVDDHSLLQGIPEKLRSISGLDMLQGYSLARIRLQYENQKQPANRHLEDFFLEAEERKIVTRELIMFERIADLGTINLTVAKVWDRFDDRVFRTIPHDNARLGILHLAAAAQLLSATKELLGLRTNKGQPSTALLASLILCSLMSAWPENPSPLLLWLLEQPVISHSSADNTFDAEQARWIFRHFQLRSQFSDSYWCRFHESRHSLEATVRGVMRNTLSYEGTTIPESWLLQARRTSEIVSCYATAAGRGDPDWPRTSFVDSLREMRSKIDSAPEAGPDPVCEFFEDALSDWAADVDQFKLLHAVSEAPKRDTKAFYERPAWQDGYSRYPSTSSWGMEGTSSIIPLMVWDTGDVYDVMRYILSNDASDNSD